MAYRIRYRSAQGQQGAGTPGGGILLDQVQFNWHTVIASGASRNFPVFIMPSLDTTDAVVSILGDYSPSPFTPRYQVIRAAIAINVSFASVASTSAPFLQLLRNRGEPASGPTSVSQAVIATWDFADISTGGFSLPFTRWARGGSLISNGALVPGDVLSLVNDPVSQTMSIPPGVLTVDIEA